MGGQSKNCCFIARDVESALGVSTSHSTAPMGSYVGASALPAGETTGVDLAEFYFGDFSCIFNFSCA